MAVGLSLDPRLTGRVALPGDVGALPAELKRASALSTDASSAAADRASASHSAAAGGGLGRSAGDVISSSSMLAGRDGGGGADGSLSAVRASGLGGADSFTGSGSSDEAGSGSVDRLRAGRDADRLALRGGAVSGGAASDMAGSQDSLLRHETLPDASRIAGGMGTVLARGDDHSSAAGTVGLPREQLPLGSGSERDPDPDAWQKELVGGEVTTDRGFGGQTAVGDGTRADTTDGSVIGGASGASAAGQSSAAGSEDGSASTVGGAGSAAAESVAGHRQGNGLASAASAGGSAAKSSSNVAMQRAATDESGLSNTDVVDGTAGALQSQRAGALNSAGGGGGGEVLVGAVEGTEAAGSLGTLAA
jgi:hypothetical protein